MRFASAIACSCCRRDRHGFSPNYLSAHRAARVAKPKLQRSRGGPTATAPSEMLDRQGLGCVLKYGIGGVVDETHDPNSSARPRSSRCDSNAQDMMRQWSPSSGPTFENLSNLRLMDFVENQRSTALA